MTVSRWFWRVAGMGAVAIIIVAAIYLSREPEKVTVRPGSAPPAVEREGRALLVDRPTAPPAAVPVAPSPSPNPPQPQAGLRDARPKLDLADFVLRLKDDPSLNPPTLGRFVGALTSARATDRAEAVEELGFSEDRRFVAAIVHLLQNDPEPTVRAAAASALELYKGREIAAALGQALSDADEEVRSHALLSLQVQRDDNVERELETQLKNGGLNEQTALDVRLFLDRHYVRKDPFKDSVVP